jgi:RHS repeat-associated protein
VAIFVKNNGLDTMYYVHIDLLGSINVITNQSGAVVQNCSFDAWGRRRNPSNWTYSNVPSTFLFSRGFTGHEHLDQFGLINMNGRIYDPILGRFFNPDNIIQVPNSSQSYNRYSYCLNNPLSVDTPFLLQSESRHFFSVFRSQKFNWTHIA